MDVKELAANLRSVRVRKKVSQTELARRAGLSRPAYVKLENGVTEPRVDTLVRIAQVLEMRIDDLLAPSPMLKHVRFRAAKRLTSREDVIAQVGIQLQGYCFLEETLGERVRFALGDLVRDARRGHGTARALTAARESAGEARKKLGLKDDEPIRDICGLLEDRGVKVLTVQIMSDAFSGLSVGPEDGGPAVVVNTWEGFSVERWIFTAAHELGHLLLHPNAYQSDETSEREVEEIEANEFASHFLMPEEVFQRELEQARGLSLFGRVLKLKRMFHVSWQTVVVRITRDKPKEEQGRVWAEFFRQWKQEEGRRVTRKEEPFPIRQTIFRGGPPASRANQETEPLHAHDFREDRRLGLVRKALDKGLITRSKAAEILGLSASDMHKLMESWVV